VGAAGSMDAPLLDVEATALSAMTVFVARGFGCGGFVVLRGDGWSGRRAGVAVSRYREGKMVVKAEERTF